MSVCPVITPDCPCGTKARTHCQDMVPRLAWKLGPVPTGENLKLRVYPGGDGDFIVEKIIGEETSAPRPKEYS